jgi:hypothetical protein
MFTDGSQDLAEWKTVLEAGINSLVTDPNQGTIQIGLEFKYIYDGLKKEERSKDSKGHKAIHVDFAEEDLAHGSNLLRTFLKSKEYKYYSNLRTTLVPVISYQLGHHEKQKAQEAMWLHGSSLEQTTDVTTYDLGDLDSPIPELEGKATLRSLIQGFKVKKGDPKHIGSPLLSRINQSYTGAGHTITFPKIFAGEARDIIENLPSYLVHERGDYMERYLTRTGREKLTTTVWDEVEQRPIGPNERHAIEAIELGKDKNMSWLDISAVTKSDTGPPVRPTKAQNQENVWDQYSQSTFGTRGPGGVVKKTQRGKLSAAALGAIEVPDDRSQDGDASVISAATGATTQSSRRRLAELEEQLATLTAMLNNGSNPGATGELKHGSPGGVP